MKTEVYEFKNNEKYTEDIIGIATKIAKYNELPVKQELRLTLLSEELVEMVPNMLQYGKGRFWIENNGSEYDIHIVVEPDTMLPSDERERILSVSRTGVNAAAVGIKNKIRIAAEVMMANYSLTAGSGSAVYPDMPYSFYEMGTYSNPAGYSNAWSLANYKDEAKDTKEAWDELEKSIIAKLADDVVVGIIGGKVEITVKARFDK